MTVVFFAFVVVGIVFGLVGSIGVITFPDVYTRLHASSKCSTTAVLSILIACLIVSGFSAMSGRVVVIIVFFFLTGPVSSHIIGFRAWRRGIPPWRTPRHDTDD